MSPTQFRRTLPIVLVSYLCLGYGTFFTGEVYPIFSWHLFSFTPEPIDDEYTIRVRFVNDEVIDDGFFGETPLPGVTTVNSAQIRRFGRRIALAHDRGDVAGADAAVDALTQLFFPLADSVGYEIVYRKYDRLERWRTGAFLETRPVAEFLYTKPNHS